MSAKNLPAADAILSFLVSLAVRTLFWSWLVMLGVSGLSHPVGLTVSIPAGVGIALIRSNRVLQEVQPVAIVGMVTTGEDTTGAEE